MSKTSTLVWPVATGLLVLTALAAPPIAGEVARNPDEALLKALPSSKHSLSDGLQQVAQGAETPISAKFELEDGKLSLSVYTAEKGLGVEAEQNVLKEYAGSPEAAAWKTEVETFKDVEHVARASEQLTLMALSSSTLADVLKKVGKDHPGTVYSIAPTLRDRKAVLAVLIADQGKSTEVLCDVLTGEVAKPREAGAPKK